MNKSSKKNFGAVRSIRSTVMSGKAPYDHDSSNAVSVRITIPNDMNKHAVETEVSKQRRPSVFARLGGETAAPIISGTYVIFENLNSNIIEDDLRELCMSVGEIKSITLNQAHGSLKRAEVVFARRSSALECITKFHSVKLDGLAMTVKLKGEAGKENPFNPIDLTSKKNVRVGLFGTSIDDTIRHDPSHEPKFKRNRQVGGQPNPKPQGLTTSR
jgi:RNA recognition motif-containing protein